MVDRVKKLLDSTTQPAAVVVSQADWATAFDRIDPTCGILSLIKIGIRPSLIPILASYLSNRKMMVKFNGKLSSPRDLVGGGPQGTGIGGLYYIISSQDCAEELDPEDRYKYFDDLSVLELVMLGGLLSSYNFKDHVASDISIDQKFLSPSHFKSQQYLTSIASWTQENLMKLNIEKSNYVYYFFSIQSQFHHSTPD